MEIFLVRRLYHGRADERTERFTLRLTQTVCESVWRTPSGGVLLTQTVCEKCMVGLVWRCVGALTDASCVESLWVLLLMCAVRGRVQGRRGGRGVIRGVLCISREAAMGAIK